MPASFLHGVETIETTAGGRPIRAVKTAVIGLIGTAPIHLLTEAADKTVNKLVVCASEKDDAKYFGPETAGFSIPSALKAIRAQGSGLVIVINVFDPATHKDVSNDPDVTKVLATDIIGTTDAGGVRSGLQAFKDARSNFGYAPKLLIAPGFSTQSGVVTEMVTIANSLRAMALIDAPAATTPAVAIAGRSVGGTINFNVTSGRVIPCYPYLQVFDAASGNNVLTPYSQFLAGVMAAKDMEKGYWWSPSNTVIEGIVGMERPLTASLSDANSEVNLLNEKGIVTVFNDGGSGFRTWGNRTAAFPTDTSAKGFINVQRTADVIHESIENAMLAYADAPLNQALIDQVVEDVNVFLRTLKGRGALIDGACWFDPAENSAAELAAGHAVFSYDFMPPTPAERFTFKSAINSAYLLSLLGGNA